MTSDIRILRNRKCMSADNSWIVGLQSGPPSYVDISCLHCTAFWDVLHH